MVVSPQVAALKVEEEPFIEFLKLVFAQKRKTLFNNLRARYDGGAIKQALQEAKVRPDVRAEALDLKKTAEVFRRLTHP